MVLLNNFGDELLFGVQLISVTSLNIVAHIGASTPHLLLEFGFVVYL